MTQTRLALVMTSLPFTLRPFAFFLLGLYVLFQAPALQAKFPAYDGAPERESFYATYNKKVLENLQLQLKDAEERLSKAKDDAEKQAIELEKQQFQARLAKPEFFTFAKPSDLPANLKWEDGMKEEEIGDDHAKKGGTFTTFIPSFPPTLRVMGENANNFFRGYQNDDVEMGLIGSHPETGNMIPAIAKSWAESPDSQTVYYRIDERATYSDGTPILVDDFFNTFYMQLSEYPQNPFGNQWYSTTYINITKYDDRTLSITLAEPKALAPYFTSLSPMPRHFYSEFGPDFEQRYQWRTRPVTGPYKIDAEDVVFGRSITLSRVKDWWAKDLKFYKNRFNVDRIVYRVIRLPEKAFELFLQGSIDFMPLDTPDYWYERSEAPPVHNGYIEKATFYRIWPSSAAGLYLNCAKAPLDQRDVRIGMSYAMNYQKVIDFDLRGDFQRIQTFSQGYPLMGNPPIKAREFSVAKAKEHFALAGYDKAGPDGILVNSKGERLSITITHRKIPLIDKYMQRLKEEAIKCGLELKLESLEGTALFQKATQKHHQVVQVAWGSSPPFPDHYQHFHSKDAFMPDGKTPRPNTNNLTSFANPQMDKFAEAERSARTVEAYREAVYGADQIIHDEAIWIPSFESNFYRVGYWRWIQWPAKVFNVSISNDALQNHVHWIDETIKAETLDAMRHGKTFPEVEEVFDRNTKFATPMPHPVQP